MLRIEPIATAGAHARNGKREHRDDTGGDRDVEAPAKEGKARAIGKDIEAHARTGEGKHEKRSEREDQGERPQPGEHGAHAT